MEKEEPIVIKSTESEKTTGRSDKSVMRRIILPIFLIIIAIEIVFGAKTLLSPINTTGKGANVQPLGAGKITLISATNNFGVGQTAVVSVRVFTGGHSTDGTDLYLKYDPSYLDISSSLGFSKGAIYGEYPVVSIDIKQGVIRVSGIATLAQGGFSGMGELGKLNFKAKKAGITSISAVYQPNATTYSNIIETTTAQNLLTASSSLDLNISQSAVNSSVSASSSCSSRVLQLCKNASGKMGTQWCTSSDDPLSCTSGCFKDQYGKDLGCKIVSDAQ